MEVIIKQMMKKVIVVESGDTDALPGSQLSVKNFTEIKQKHY